MGFVTFLGLVARRVWAQKGILFGSVLGATLVIALLVVVPLYEASVQAVDLQFSVDGAVDDEVDVAALSVLNDYDSVAGELNRGIVADAQRRWLQPWYPTREERSQTREFVVIRSGGDAPNDFIGMGREWKADTADFLEEGGDPDDVPRPPYPRRGVEPTQVRVFTSPDLEELLIVVEGAYDTTTQLSAEAYTPIPVMIGEGAARLAGVQVGDTFFLTPFAGLPSVFEWVEVVAIVAPVDANAGIWGIDDPARMLYFDQDSFDTWLREIPTMREVDPWARSSRGLPNIGVTQRWTLPLDRGRVALQDVSELTSRLDQFRAEVARESGGAIPVTTPIIRLLDDFGTRSVVVGAPILAMLALVVGGAVYFLVFTSAMTVERQGTEMALLRSRGASSWQTVGIHLGQSVVLAGVAALVAPFVARFLVGFTGRVPPLSTLTGGAPLEVEQVRSVVPFLVAGAGVTFVAMGIAILPFARRGVLALRSLATRPGTRSVWQAYNIDIYAIVLAIVLLAQLRLRGFIDLSSGEATLDPLAIIFPALLLFAGALILLRVFPFVLRLVGWILTKPRSLSTALAGWNLGRNPVPYGRLALLVWVTTGLGVFALTYAATLEQSYTDRAEFTAGADVRIVGADAGYAVAPEGAVGTPVLRTIGAPRLVGRGAEVLAVIPEGFADVVIWRSDFAGGETGETPAEVFGQLRPDGGAPIVGVDVPIDASALRIEGIVEPLSLLEESVSDDPRGRNHRLLLKVVDGMFRVWTMVSDVDFVDTEWREVTIDLATGRNTQFASPPTPPFTIMTMWVERPSPTDRFPVNGDVLYLGALTAVTPERDVPLDTTSLIAADDLRIARDVDAGDAARSRYSEVPAGETAPSLGEMQASPLWRAGVVERWTLPSNRTRANPRVPQARHEPPAFRVLLDQTAGAAAGLGVGDVSNYSIGAQIVPGEVAGFVERVPTATDRRRLGVMVIDFAVYNAWANGSATWSLSGGPGAVEGPGELWVSTADPDSVIRVVEAQMVDAPDRIWTIRGVEAEFASRPIQIGLVAILFVGAATGVVLALAGVTGYVMLALSRRDREMDVLRALGFERTSVGATFALEQFVVIGLGAAIGALGGVGLVVVMLPFLQLGETAAVIEPPILLSLPGPQLIGYLAVVGVLLIVSVLWATRRVSVRRMSEVLREVER